MPADQALRHKSYLGVACPTPNRVTCDRIGLYVQLARSAVGVRARIGDRSFALDDARQEGKDFVGFLQPAGLGEPGPLEAVVPEPGRRRWIGVDPVSTMVTLQIERGSGALERTQERVAVMAGYG